MQIFGVDAVAELVFRRGLRGGSTFRNPIVTVRLNHRMISDHPYFAKNPPLASTGFPIRETRESISKGRVRRPKNRFGVRQRHTTYEEKPATSYLHQRV